MLFCLAVLLVCVVTWHGLCVYSSLYFDGGYRYAVIDDYSLIDSIGYDEFTIQTWFLVDGDNCDTFSAFVSNRGCSCYEGFLYGYSTYGGQDATWHQYKWNRFPGSTYHYDDDQWHHSVLLRNSSHISMFVDATAISSVPINSDPYYSITNSHSIWIGLDYGSQSSTQYAGYIDDIAIWSRALDLSEIEDLSQHSLMDLNYDSSSYGDELLHYYPLDSVMSSNSQYLEDVANGHHAYLGSSDTTTTYDPEISTNEPVYYPTSTARSAPSTSPSLLPSALPSAAPSLPSALPGPAPRPSLTTRVPRHSSDNRSDTGQSIVNVVLFSGLSALVLILCVVLLACWCYGEKRGKHKDTSTDDMVTIQTQGDSGESKVSAHVTREQTVSPLQQSPHVTNEVGLSGEEAAGQTNTTRYHQSEGETQPTGN